MSSTFQQGHVHNKANFQILVKTVETFGEKYNPSQQRLQLATLRALLASAQDALQNLRSTEAATSAVRAERWTAFDALDPLAIRLKNAVIVGGAEQMIIDKISSLVKKIHGQRVIPDLIDEERNAVETVGKTVPENSAAQIGVDDQIVHFDNFIKTLEAIKTYAPKEDELKVENLKLFCQELIDKDNTVKRAEIIEDRVLSFRNEVFYTDVSGMVDVASDVKLYIKSVFGNTSSEYKSLAGLKFIRYK
jgi:hypothetical protein